MTHTIELADIPVVQFKNTISKDHPALTADQHFEMMLYHQAKAREEANWRRELFAAFEQEPKDQKCKEPPDFGKCKKEAAMMQGIWARSLERQRLHAKNFYHHREQRDLKTERGIAS